MNAVHPTFAPILAAIAPKPTGTVTDRINALGGTASTPHDVGYVAAIDAALPIAEDADQVIAELVETVEDLLLMRSADMARWAKEATTLLARLRARGVVA